MSTIPFLRDQIFWITLAILSAFSLAGFLSAWLDDWATVGQMLRHTKHGIPWAGHFGFWSVTFVVHPVLAWTTAKMWPLWQGRIPIFLLCCGVGLLLGLLLQRSWSAAAGSSDAWSTLGKPNDTGQIHILHMGPEIGIMLMLAMSGLWFREMTVPMFIGIVLILANHFLMGTHWPLRIWLPDWRPEDMYRLTPVSATIHIIASVVFLGGGISLLTLV